MQDKADEKARLRHELLQIHRLARLADVVFGIIYYSPNKFAVRFYGKRLRRLKDASR